MIGPKEGSKSEPTGKARFLRSAEESIVAHRNPLSGLREARTTSLKKVGIFGASFAPIVETITFRAPLKSSSSLSTWAVRLKKHFRSELILRSIFRIKFLSYAPLAGIRRRLVSDRRAPPNVRPTRQGVDVEGALRPPSRGVAKTFASSFALKIL